MCEQCGRLFESASGLGSHLGQRHPGTVQLITCRGCGRRARLLAKEMCRPCYDKARRAPRICRDCGELRRHVGNGRCARCHRQASRKAPATCSECLAWGPLVGGVCAACRLFKRSNARGLCPRCRREVSIGRDGRCRLCMIAYRETGSKEGICSDCGLWAPLIANGVCNSCLVFRFRCSTGICSVCRREVVVGKLGRCRRCMVEGARAGKRYPGRPMLEDQLEAVPPSTRATKDIQLFFVGMRDANRWPSRTGHAKRHRDGRRQLPRQHVVQQASITVGQLRLLWLPAEVSTIDVEEAVSAAAVEIPDLFTSIEVFGERRGWSEVTVRQVQRATAVLMAMRCGEAEFDPSALEGLGALQLPLSPTLDFVSDAGLFEVDPEAKLDAWVEDRLRPLSEQIRHEVRSWIEVLRGRSKRRGRSYRPTTVKAYVRACQAALNEWSSRYGSLRQVTPDDVEEQLEGLAGWDLPNTLVGMRSLFRTLKADRRIFTDPTARVEARVPSRRPPLSLDPVVRSSLLDQVDRPDHKLILLLAGVHALSVSQIADLCLEDIDLPRARFYVSGKPRALDGLTRDHFKAWLDLRRTRWPHTANPHVLVTTHSANRVTPVGKTYVKSAFRGLPVSLSELRVDRFVCEAMENRGDALRLAKLFGMSAQTATDYAASFGAFDEVQADEFGEFSPR